MLSVAGPTSRRRTATGCACGGTLDRPHRFGGRAARAIDSRPGGPVPGAERNRSVLRFESRHEPQRFVAAARPARCERSPIVRRPRRRSSTRARLRRARVLEDDATAHETDGAEAANLLGNRTAADFLDRRRRLARIVERGARTGLPSRVDTVGAHTLPSGFRWRLPALRLAVGLVIRPRRQRFRGHGVAAPDGGDAQQVGVEPDPVAAARGSR